MNQKKQLFGSCFGAILLFTIAAAQAQTMYTWTGVIDTNWANSANWTSGAIPPTGGLDNSTRVNVSNGASNICYYTAAQGYTTVVASSLNTTRSLVIGSSTSGSMVINGGTWESQLGADDVDGNGNASGSLTINGGNYVYINGSGNNAIDVNLDCTQSTNSGTLNVDNGTVTVGSVLLGEAGGAIGSATINLNGGTLSVNGIAVQATGSGGNFYATNNFNGGTLEALENANIIHGLPVTANSLVHFKVNVLAGGAIVNAQTFSITNTQPLLNGNGVSDGGLTLLGTGSLTMLGTNTYNGPTIVSNGTLVVNAASTGGGPYINGTNTTLGINITSAGSELRMSQWSLGGQCTNIFNLGASGTPTNPVIYATNLIVSGTNFVNVAGTGLNFGQFALIKYVSATGLTIGSFVTNAFPAGVSGYISNNIANNSVDLVVTAAPTLVWVGATNGMRTTSWDIRGTSNWVNQSSGGPAFFTGVESVIFNDSVTGTNFVNLTTNLEPNLVLITNNIIHYTFGGLGNIAGYANLTKSGAAILTLTTSGNAYTGGTIINGGTLQIGAIDALPTNGDVTLSGTGTLDLTNFSTEINALIGSSGMVTNSDAAATPQLVLGGNIAGANFSGSIGGAINLTTTNTSEIEILAGNNSYIGQTTVGNGALRVASTTALGSPGNTVVVNSGSRLELSGGITVADYPITLYGSGGNNYGAIQSYGGSNTWTGNVVISDGTTRIGALNGSTLNIAGVLSGPDGIIIRGDINNSSGTIVLSGANIYNGDTTEWNNPLQLGSQNTLPATTTLHIGDGEFFTGELDMNGYNQTVAGLIGYSTYPTVIGNSSTTSDATLTIGGAYNTNTTYGGIIQNTLGTGTHKVNLTVAGGSLNLSGTNTYTGNTVVNVGTLVVSGILGDSIVNVSSGGTLGGNGLINGVTMIYPGGNLQPDLSGATSTSTLTISNTLTLGGTTMMALNSTNAQTSSQITGVTTLIAGGTLTVTNVGPMLQAGDTFTLFTTTPFGTFGTINLPSLPARQVWVTTNNYAVISVVNVVSPTLTDITLSGSVLALSGTATPNYSYVLLTTTNLLSPWWPILTNTADNNGNLSFIDSHATNSQRFYRTEY